MGEAQIIHDDEFDTSGSTPKTGLFNSGSGYYNPHTGTFLGGSGAPASANPSSTSAEEPTAQSTRPASQLGAHAAISSTAGSVPSSAGCASSTDVSPAAPYQGINLYGALDTPVDASEDPMKWLACADMPEKDIWGMNRMEEEAERMREYFRELMSKWEEERRYKEEFDRYWNLGEEGRKAERKANEGKPRVADNLTPEGRARAKIDNWDAIPHNDAEGNMQRKIMDDYNSNHNSKYDAKWFAENLVWAAWGHLNEGYTGPNGQEVKAGYYLFGYQVGQKGPRLFWGPGGPSLSYFPQPGTEFGEWRTPYGQRLGASTFMRSWLSRYGGNLDITMGGVNNTGRDINIYMSGSVSNDGKVWINDRRMFTIKKDGRIEGIREGNDPQRLERNNSGKDSWIWNGNVIDNYCEGTIYVEFLNDDGSVFELYRFKGWGRNGYWKDGTKARDINPLMERI